MCRPLSGPWLVEQALIIRLDESGSWQVLQGEVVRPGERPLGRVNRFDHLVWDEVLDVIDGCCSPF